MPGYAVAEEKACGGPPNKDFLLVDLQKSAEKTLKFELYELHEGGEPGKTTNKQCLY